MGNAQDWCLASSVYPDVEVACLVAEGEDGVEDEEAEEPGDKGEEDGDVDDTAPGEGALVTFKFEAVHIVY